MRSAWKIPTPVCALLTVRTTKLPCVPMTELGQLIFSPCGVGSEKQLIDPFIFCFEPGEPHGTCTTNLLNIALWLHNLAITFAWNTHTSLEWIEWVMGWICHILCGLGCSCTQNRSALSCCETFFSFLYNLEGSISKHLIYWINGRAEVLALKTTAGNSILGRSYLTGANLNCRQKGKIKMRGTFIV